jgi:hypothetical protein
VPFLWWRMDLPLLLPFGTVLLGFRSCSANPLVDCLSSSLPLHCLGRLALSHKNGELFHPYHATHLALNHCPSAEKGPRNSEYLKVVKIMQKKRKNRSPPRMVLGRRPGKQCRNTRIFVMLSLGAERPSRTDR